jgi:hypothetical protein
MADDRPVPDWLLERLARDELPVAEAARLRARLEARGEGARLLAIELSDREILAAHSPAAVAAEVHRRARLGQVSRPAMGWRSVVFSGLALGAAGLAVVFALARSPRQSAVGLGGPAASEAEVITARGLAPRLALYRKQDKRADRLDDGATAGPGDLLQVAYLAAGRRYGVIASMDARNTVTLHLPESAGPAARLPTGKEIVLPHAFELDASPGFERFVFVTSDSPFDSVAVVSWLRDKDSSLPAGLSLTTVTLYKASR